jgi:hypothetical protein
LRFEVHEVLLGGFDGGCGCIPEFADTREEGGAVDPGVGDFFELVGIQVFELAYVDVDLGFGEGAVVVLGEEFEDGYNF